MSDIPGRIDAAGLAALFGDDRAVQHAPKDRMGYIRSAADLAARGYPPTEIAHALKLTVAGVRELLMEADRMTPKPMRRYRRG